MKTLQDFISESILDDPEKIAKNLTSIKVRNNKMSANERKKLLELIKMQYGDEDFYMCIAEQYRPDESCYESEYDEDEDEYYDPERNEDDDAFRIDNNTQMYGFDNIDEYAESIGDILDAWGVDEGYAYCLWAANRAGTDGDWRLGLYRTQKPRYQTRFG